MVTCLSQDDPNHVWEFCPSIGPNYLFTILFGFVSIAHIVQAVMYKKGYSWVMIVATIWQTGTYAARLASIYMPSNSNVYSIWFIMILVGPLWINAYVYMVVARMVYNFMPTQKVAGIKAWRFGTWFVLLDIAVFLGQLAGASIASQEDGTYSQLMLGIHIYMIGVGVQQFIIFVFTGILIRFHLRLRQNPPSSNSASAFRLLYVIYIALVLITIRIIFRLVEYSSGIDGSIPRKEAYMYCLETTPMFIAVLLFNIVHPGKVMPGPEADLPSRKQRKRMAKVDKNNTAYKPVDNNDAEMGLLGVYNTPEYNSSQTAMTPPPPETYHQVPADYRSADYRS